MDYGKKMPGLREIMGDGKMDGEDSAPDSDESLSPEDHKTSMREASDHMMEAMKSGDKEGFHKALHAFHDMKMNEPPAGDMADDDGAGDDGATSYMHGGLRL